ncbi:MAG TPA: hypothetical protein VK821_20020 [Dehalococcoidia bacterium]|nr:hypothetical protein [Dehalococcoidia bacterium]
MRDERSDRPAINREDEVPEFTTVEDEAAFWATHQLGPDLRRTLERRSLVELLEIRAIADRLAAPGRGWI